MKKEVALAIFIGTVIGLVVAFGTWKLIASFKKVELSTPQPKPSFNSNFAVSLAKPSDWSITSEEEMSVSGVTKPEATVIISTLSKDYEVKSDETGGFEETILLNAGVNKILVTAFDSNFDQTSVEVNVIYSQEFAKYQKGNENKKATAFIGTVTDISATSVQIKSIDGEILQASISDETTYSKSDQLAIGDYAALLGYKNGNSVLDAKRVLVGPSSEELPVSLIAGKIISATKKDFLLKSEKDEEAKVILPKKWVGPEIKSVGAEDTIIVIAFDEDNILTLRTLLVKNQ